MRVPAWTARPRAPRRRLPRGRPSRRRCWSDRRGCACCDGVARRARSRRRVSSNVALTPTLAHGAAHEHARARVRSGDLSRRQMGRLLLRRARTNRHLGDVCGQWCDAEPHRVARHASAGADQHQRARHLARRRKPGVLRDARRDAERVRHLGDAGAARWPAAQTVGRYAGRPVVAGWQAPGVHPARLLAGGRPDCRRCRRQQPARDSGGRRWPARPLADVVAGWPEPLFHLHLPTLEHRAVRDLPRARRRRRAGSRREEYSARGVPRAAARRGSAVLRQPRERGPRLMVAIATRRSRHSAHDGCGRVHGSARLERRATPRVHGPRSSGNRSWPST